MVTVFPWTEGLIRLTVPFNVWLALLNSQLSPGLTKLLSSEIEHSTINSFPTPIETRRAFSVKNFPLSA